MPVPPLLAALVLLCTGQAWAAGTQDGCAACLGSSSQPVCTTLGLTVTSACWAQCQGLEIAAHQPCSGGDPLHLGMVQAVRRRTLSGVVEDDGSGQGSAGRSCADGIAQRFATDGFVFVGHATVGSPVAAAHDAGFGHRPQPGSNNSGAHQGTALDESQQQQQRGSWQAGQISKAGQQVVLLRAVRVTPDGAIYMERTPLPLDVRTLPHADATDGSPHPDAYTGSSSSGAASGSRRLLTDDRYVADVSAYPSTAIGYLESSVGGDIIVPCTGTFISGRDVLLAASCIMDMVTGVVRSEWTFWRASFALDFKEEYSPEFATLYRTEMQAAISDQRYMYYNIALLRTAETSPEYMGIKYSCTQTEYPKAATCGYNDKKFNPDTTEVYPYCDDCYWTSNACNPFLMVANWCYSSSDDLGAPIFDRADSRVLGVLSGNPSGPQASAMGITDVYDVSVWVPIDKLQFTALKRWMWPTSAADAPTTPPVTALPLACTVDGDIRLVGGPDQSSGRVEVCRRGSWGTVCATGFDQQDATVVCRQLGYASGQHTRPAFFAPGSSQQDVWLEDVACTGTEARLFDCSPAKDKDFGSRCQHSLDAGVICSTSATPDVGERTAGAMVDTTTNFNCSTPNQIRLQGSGDMEGRVEVCLNGLWGSVCDDGWDDTDAIVLCRSMNYVYGQALRGPMYNGPSPAGPAGMKIWLDQVACTGTETNLLACPAVVGIADCSHRQDAGVRCSQYPFKTQGVLPRQGSCGAPGSIRLVGGKTANTGRLEVCNDDVWGAVCESQFDDVDASVACLQLGYMLGGKATSFARQTGQPIWMNRISCGFVQQLAAGFAPWPVRLTSCVFQGMAKAECPNTDTKVAGVECITKAQSSPTPSPTRTSQPPPSPPPRRRRQPKASPSPSPSSSPSPKRTKPSPSTVVVINP